MKTQSKAGAKPGSAKKSQDQTCHQEIASGGQSQIGRQPQRNVSAELASRLEESFVTNRATANALADRLVQLRDQASDDALRSVSVRQRPRNLPNLRTPRLLE
jgi:hypothetical protein